MYFEKIFLAVKSTKSIGKLKLEKEKIARK